MSLASEYMVSRLDVGRDKAALRRHKGLATGKAAAGWIRSPTSYGPLPAKGTPERLELETQALADYEAWCARPEPESELMTDADWRDYLGAAEEWPAGLQSDRPVTANHPAKGNNPGDARQLGKANTVRDVGEMSADEFAETCEALFGSVYKAAEPLGMTYRQLRRMAIGESAVHPTVARLLWILAGRLKPRDLLP